MRRVEADADWSLFCPSEAPGLADVHSEAFDELYARYEKEGRARRIIKARQLFAAIFDAQVETGTPYLLYKDACNAKSNHQHLGTIRSSNLCTEIVEYTAPDEIAVCNLASIALPKFVRSDGYFDYRDLTRVVRVAIKNLDRVIDRNFYPVPEAERSNLRHRPVGLGVQGLADVFQILKIPFDSKEAVALSERIFETMYHAALSESVELAKRKGFYETFPGSPTSEGRLQFDLWGKTEEVHEKYGRERWETLRASVRTHGLRNSLLIAPMPTASTSQILGNVEGIEPLQSNMYSRGTLAGEFTIVNQRLVEELESRGLWNAATRHQLVRDRGSASNLGLPEDVAKVYKTVWETSQKWLIDHAVARGPFVCQSQSLNLYVAEPTAGRLGSMHLYGWRQGLKTSIYYLRSKPAAQTIQFSLEAPSSDDKAEGEEECLMCGS